MKVNEGKELNLQLKRLEQDKRRMVSAHENEVETLKKFYAQQKQELLNDSQTQIFDERKRTQMEITKASEEGEAKLAQQLERMQKEDERLNTLAEEIKKKEIATLKENELDLNTKIVAKQAEFEEKQLAMQGKAEEDLGKERMSQESTLNSQRLSNLATLAENQKMADLGLAKKSNQYKELQRMQMVEHSRQTIQNERAQREKMMNQMVKSEHEYQTQLALHKKQMEESKAHHEFILNKEKNSFETKYKTMMENHSNVIDRVKQQMELEYKELAKDSSAMKKDFATKSEDPFYRPNVIAPQITESKDHYVISVKIPEHEKESVSLNADKRLLTLNFSRQYKGNIEEADGTVNRSAKSESFGRSFSVGEIVDASSIRQSYNNGHLHFLIKKA